MKRTPTKVLSLVLACSVVAGGMSATMQAAEQPVLEIAAVEQMEQNVQALQPVEEYNDSRESMTQQEHLIHVGDQGYETLAEAIAAASDSEMIVLSGDIQIAEKITIDHSVTIDGNGHTIRGQSGDADVYFEITGGNVTFYNVKLQEFGDSVAASGRNAVIQVPDGLGSEIKVVADQVTISKFCRAGMDIRSGSFEVRNSNIDLASTNEDNAVKARAIFAGLGADAVTGSIVDTAIYNSVAEQADWQSASVEVYSNASVSIRGGEISGSLVGVYVDNYWAGQGSYASIPAEAKAEVTMDGTNVTAQADAVRLYSRPDQTRSSLVQINSGSFNGGVELITGSEHDKLEIRGGWFSQDPSAYLAKGYTVTGEGPYQVVSSASVEEPETDGEQTTVKAEVQPVISDSAANAAMTADVMDSKVESLLQAAESAQTSPVFAITVPVTPEVDSLYMTLPVSSLQTLSQNGQAKLQILSDAGSVTLDAAAISALAQQAGGVDLTIGIAPVEKDSLNEQQQAAAGDAPVYELSVTSSGVAVYSIAGGSAELMLPYTLAPEQSADRVEARYLAEDGSLTAYQTEYHADTQMVSFTTEHFAKHVIAYRDAAWENPFTDVQEDAWYFDAVQYMQQKGLMVGVSANSFAPEQATSRAMLVSMLYRLEGSPAVQSENPFQDVAANRWYTNAVIWAAERGIVSGYTADTFGPERNLSREQMAAILYRYASYKQMDVSATSDLSGFKDLAQLSNYAKTAMQWAHAEGLIVGMSSEILAPAGTASRAQMAAVMMRFCENVMTQPMP